MKKTIMTTLVVMGIIGISSFAFAGGCGSMGKGEKMDHSNGMGKMNCMKDMSCSCMKDKMNHTFKYIGIDRLTQASKDNVQKLESDFKSKVEVLHNTLMVRQLELGTLGKNNGDLEHIRKISEEMVMLKNQIKKEHETYFDLLDKQYNIKVDRGCMSEMKHHDMNQHGKNEHKMIKEDSDKIHMEHKKDNVKNSDIQHNNHTEHK